MTSTESSPVRYNANHAGYQLWVALCLVRYYTDQWEMIHGPLSEAELDRIIDIARPLGTTLNIPEARWPSSWAEYEQRFAEGLDDVAIDDTVREYLQSLANFQVLEIRMGKLGTLAHKTIGPWNLSMTKFAVPRRIRDEMRWQITPGDLRRRRMVLAASTALGKVLPKPLRVYYALNILDLRVRRAGERRLLAGRLPRQRSVVGRTYRPSCSSRAEIRGSVLGTGASLSTQESPSK